MTKIQMTKTKTIPQHRIAFVLNFEIWNFGFVSDFDIRISNLLSLYDNRGLTQEQSSQLDTDEADEGEEGGDDPETDHDFRFGNPQELVGVMDRSPIKDAPF